MYKLFGSQEPCQELRSGVTPAGKAAMADDIDDGWGPHYPVPSLTGHDGWGGAMLIVTD